MHRRIILAVVLASLVLTGGIWFIALSAVENEFESAVADEYKINANLAIALEEHTVRTFKSAEQVVRILRQAFADHGAKTDLAGYMANGAIDDTLFTIASLANERGDLILSSKALTPANVADRDYFKHHQLHRDDLPYIDKPQLGRISRKWQIPMSLRIDKQDGSFGGVIVLSINPEYFADFYRKTNIGRNGLLALVGLDGITRVRQVGDKTSNSEDMRDTRLFASQAANPVGNFLGQGKTDGVPRYTSYRTLKQYPLIVEVGTSQLDALARVREQARGNYLAAAAVSALIVLFAAGLILVLARQWRAVDALASSEAQFRTTFDHAALGIAHNALDGRFIQVNQKLCDMLGYTKEELLRRSFIEITHPDDLATTKNRVSEALAGNTDSIVRELEKRYLHKNGSVVWVSISVALVQGAIGKPQYLVAAIQDITERKRAETLTSLEHSVARWLAAAGSAARGLEMTIRGICEALDWSYGRFWRLDEAAGVLRAGEYWCVPDGKVKEYLTKTNDIEYAPGVGLSGFVLQSGKPLWVADMSKDDRVLQTALVSETGLRSSCNFPVVSDGKTLGVLAFVSLTIREPNPRLLAAMTTIGNQIGQFLQRIEAEERLRRFRGAMDATVDAIYLTDADNLTFLDINEAACRMREQTREEMFAQGPAGVLGVSPEELRRTYDSIIAGGPAAEPLEFQRSRKDGSLIWVELRRRAVRSGKSWTIVTLVRDITERKNLQERLLHQANFDNLTQLPNRALCYDRLKQALIQARRKSGRTGVLYIDLDRFKAVNDTLGHGIGDQLLQQVSLRLKRCVRAGDTVGRLGGDEFVIILPEVAEAQDCGLIARKAVEALAEPFKLDGHEVNIAASIGIAAFPDDGSAFDELLKNADAAMFKAKQSGRNGFRFYAAELNRQPPEKDAA